MDQKELRELEAKCTQESPPACTATCPLHVDARALAARVSAGDWPKALEILKKRQPFPGILSRICDHPCQEACKRREAGEAIEISALENAIVRGEWANVAAASVPAQISGRDAAGKAVPKALRNLAPPPKTAPVAVVGGGLSGLTAALELAKKGYPTTLFEAGNRLGGKLLKIDQRRLPSEVLEAELAVLSELGVKIRLQTALGREVTLEELRQEYTAVCLALGEDGAKLLTGQGELSAPMPDGGGAADAAHSTALSAPDPVTLETGLPGVFVCGSLRGNLRNIFGRSGEEYSPVFAAADGRRAAISIDRYLQKASLTVGRENEGTFETNLYTDTSRIPPLQAIRPGDAADAYTPEQATEEAGRCLQCECLECVKACRYLQEYGSYPKRYVREIYNNESIVMGMRHANKMINSCSLCGQCAVVCPNNLDVGALIRKTRSSMTQRGKMPPSAHDFALRDLSFNNSERFTLARHQPGTESSAYFFFPGCQLSGTAPEQVEKAYAYLRDKLPGGVGMMLRCCGAPADWAAKDELFKESLDSVSKLWEEMGKPTLVLACPNCQLTFKQNLPQIPVISLWEIFDEKGLPEINTAIKAAAAAPTAGLRLAVHDSCAARHEPEVQEAVRHLLTKLGHDIEELPLNREKTQCCGFGGLMHFANPDLAKEVVKERVGQSTADYVSYCAFCRNTFAEGCKRSLHLLDLILGEDPEQAATRKSPGFSERRANRAALKAGLLRRVWHDEPASEGGYEVIKLMIPETVRDIFEKRRIVDDDIRKVVFAAEQTGNRFVHPETGRFLASGKDRNVTYWVEYYPREDGFVVANAYSHRMEIVEDVKA